MRNISFSSLFKFLTGIALVQLATAMLVLLAMRTDDQQMWLLILLLTLTLCLITAFWFGSIVNHAKKDALTQMQENFSREREKIRVRAEQEKTRVIEKSHQKIIKDRSLTQAKANTKTAVMFAGVLTLGGILAFTQFFTFGLLLISTTGGALSGYLFRSRQLFLAQKQKPVLSVSDSNKRIQGKVGG